MSGTTLDVISKQLSDNTKPESNSAISINDDDNDQKSVQSGKSIDSTNSESLKKLYDIHSFDVWAMGITIVMGGQYFSWNAGFSAGFGTFAIASFLIGLAYISLIFCICEITSALPFSGGSYGLARCTQGNYFGFILGSLEAIQYIFYVASSSYSLGIMITLIEPSMIGYEPIIWLIFYIFSLSIFIFGGKYFWKFNLFLAIISIIILLLFAFGSLHYVNFNQYAATPNSAIGNTNKWFVGGMNEFMKVLPLAAWLFVGVESLKMMCDDLPKSAASIQVPRGQISCVFTLFITMILVLFITPSLPPGISELITNIVPFNTGFQLMFSLTTHQTSQYATILSIPATFATAFGFILMYGKIIVSMSNSKLFPSFLNARYSVTGAPYAALICGSLLSYIFCLAVYYYAYFGLQLFNICILSAFLAYVCQIIGYINIKSKFKYVKRTFVSPLGIPGAIFSLLIWILGIISIIAFQDDNQFALIALVIIIFVLSLWYFEVAQKQQSFSDEEKNILFNIHVINHNLQKKKKRRNGPKSGASISNFNRQSSNSNNRRSQNSSHNNSCKNDASESKYSFSIISNSFKKINQSSSSSSSAAASGSRRNNNNDNNNNNSSCEYSEDGGRNSSSLDVIDNSNSNSNGNNSDSNIIINTNNNSSSNTTATSTQQPSSSSSSSSIDLLDNAPNKTNSYHNSHIAHRLLSSRNKVGIEIFNSLNNDDHDDDEKNQS